MIPHGDIDALTAPPARDTDPLEIIREQNKSRLQHLIPVRIGRMLESPFSYYRGTAGPMAADLRTRADSGVHLLICGDAHISNFGYYASPERNLLFDLNDFDEAGIGPWEWDLKRLAVSVYLAAVDNGESSSTAQLLAEKTSKYYREAILSFNELSPMERYYSHVDTETFEQMLKAGQQEQFSKFVAKARKRTSAHALQKFTVQDEHGHHRIVDQPPLTQHISSDEHNLNRVVEQLWEQYHKTARADISYLLRNYSLQDFVIRVVGVGSVGTRCFIGLLEDRNKDPFFLQFKEANDSVLKTYGKVKQKLDSSTLNFAPQSNGERVINAQQVLQAQSDPFLGWLTAENTEGKQHDFYVRQFRDMKGSIDLATLDRDGLKQTAKVCARLLARAHSQSTLTDDITVFCEASKPFDEAMGQFSASYARTCTEDFKNLKAAVDKGLFTVEYGL